MTKIKEKYKLLTGKLVEVRMGIYTKRWAKGLLVMDKVPSGNSEDRYMYYYYLYNNTEIGSHPDYTFSEGGPIDRKDTSYRYSFFVGWVSADNYDLYEIKEIK